MQRKMRIKPRFWTFLIVIMLICFGTSYAVAQIQYNEAAERVEALAAKKAALQEEIETLSSRLEYVRTDAYIERVARDELNMIMPGEIRYVSNSL